MMSNTGTPPTLSRCGEIVREKDPDRFLTALTADAADREALFALYAFNHEIAKIQDAVSEPMLGNIRLQWWREAIDECYAGTPRRHEVVRPLAEAIASRAPSRRLFESLIDVRTRDLDDTAPKSMAAFQEYAEQSGGVLCELAWEMLGGTDDRERSTARLVGTAWALTGLVRALPFQAQKRRSMLPGDLLDRHGVSRQDIHELRQPEALFPAVQEVCGLAGDKLSEARAGRSGIGRRQLPALHIASLTQSYLKQLRKMAYNPYDPRMATKPVSRTMRMMLRHWTNRF